MSLKYELRKIYPGDLSLVKLLIRIEKINLALELKLMKNFIALVICCELGPEDIEKT